MAIQIARAYGADVFATGSEASKPMIEALGASFIDRSENVESFVRRLTGDQGFDLVFDTVGGAALDGAFAAVLWFGHVASSLGCGTHALVPLSFRAATYSGVFTLQPLLTGEGRAHRGAILSEPTRMAEARQLSPSLGAHRLTLDQVDVACRLITELQARGKISIDIEAAVAS